MMLVMLMMLIMLIMLMILMMLIMLMVLVLMMLMMLMMTPTSVEEHRREEMKPLFETVVATSTKIDKVLRRKLPGFMRGELTSTESSLPLESLDEAESKD